MIGFGGNVRVWLAAGDTDAENVAWRAHAGCCGICAGATDILARRWTMLWPRSVRSTARSGSDRLRPRNRRFGPRCLVFWIAPFSKRRSRFEKLPV